MLTGFLKAGMASLAILAAAGVNAPVHIARSHAADAALKTYTHPKAGFSLDYSATLKAVPGRPDAETVPSEEFEWRFPNGEEGARRAIFLGFYDMPQGETLQAWLREQGGKSESIKIGPEQNIAAYLRTALDSWAYEREVYVPDEKRGIIVALALVIQIAKRGTQGGVAAIESEHADTIAAYMQMVRSFRR